MKENNNLKKKEIIVIFVNLLVLTLVVYIYYIVKNIQSILSNKNSLCVLKPSTKIDIANGKYIDEIFTEYSKLTNQNGNIRHTRSANSIKCNSILIYTFYIIIFTFLIM